MTDPASVQASIVDEWISSREPPDGIVDLSAMESLFPKVYSRYIRLFHRVADQSGNRILWKDLCHYLDVSYNSSINAQSLIEAMGGWGSWTSMFEGPSEGELDGESAKALVEILDEYDLGQNPNVIYIWYPFPSKERRLGTVSNLVQYCADSSRFGPEYMYSTDGRWVLCTPYDSTTSWIACSDRLAEALLGSSELECLEVRLPTEPGV